VEKDEENEEGDHGSIVAFRISYRPSVDFRPLPLHSPLQLLQHRLCTPCISPPPFVPSTIVPVIPQSPLPGLLFPLHHPATRTRPSTLDRRVLAVLARVDVHASLRRPRPTDQTSDTLLSSPPFPPFFSSSLVHLHISSHSLFLACSIFALSISPSLFLSASCRFPSRRIAASEGEARAAQSRSVAWMIISICANGRMSGWVSGEHNARVRFQVCVCVSGCLYATDATRRDVCTPPPLPFDVHLRPYAIYSHSHSHNFDSTIASRRLSENKHSNKKLQFASSICHMWCVRRDAISATSVIPSLLFIRCKTEIKWHKNANNVLPKALISVR